VSLYISSVDQLEKGEPKRYSYFTELPFFVSSFSRRNLITLLEQVVKRDVITLLEQYVTNQERDLTVGEMSVQNFTQTLGSI
jgi:hypothetical protein